MEILHHNYSTTAHKIRPHLCLALHLDFGMILESRVGLGIDAVEIFLRLAKFFLKKIVFPKQIFSIFMLIF